MTIFLGIALVPYIFYILESFSPETFVQKNVGSFNERNDPSAGEK